jgi:hypothetical protein
LERAIDCQADVTGGFRRSVNVSPAHFRSNQQD